MALRVLHRHLSKRWSYFIQKVYETDPLICVFHFRNFPKSDKTVLKRN